MISVPEAMAFVKLSCDEERALAKLEAAIDSKIHESFDGTPARIEFKQHVAPKIAHALQRKYEEQGGWRVSVAPLAETCAFGFVAAPRAPVSTTILTRAATEEPLPAIINVEPASSAKSGKRLLIRFPTRGRPKQALSVLAAYRAHAGVPATIEVVIDDDDESMLAAPVLQRLTTLGCLVTVGKWGSKIAACNGGYFNDWDIILLASDDMVPIVTNYGGHVLKAMEDNYPFNDGAVYFDDGFQGPELCTLPIMGRKLYDQFGYIYHPTYKSLFSDTEQTAVLRQMGRLTYINQKIIEHRHHVWRKAEKDALYVRNDAFWAQDEATFKARSEQRRPHAQLAFDTPPLWLSICIATIPKRKIMLENLLEHIYRQAERHPLEVEVLIDNRLNMTIGQKRTALVKRAKGRFVAFVDDDDMVSHDYVDRVVAAVSSQPEVDCAALHGIITTAGAVPEPFVHSIVNTEWTTKNGVHYRTPNHLNAVRRELALKVGFQDISHGEDHDYAMRLKPFLQKEVSTGDAPLYYYFFIPGKGAGG